MDNLERAAIFQMHAGFCKNLADANRLLIIAELAASELPVGELSSRLSLHQSNVSKHLALMREYGLVSTRREGTTIYYRLSDPRIYEAIKLLKQVQLDQIEKQRTLVWSNI